MSRVARIVVPGFPHHVTQRGNRRADVFLDAIPDWRAWRYEPFESEDDYYTAIRRQTLTGRPCGTPDFVERLEKRTGRTLRPKRRGPKYRNRKVSSSVPKTY